MQSQLVDPVRLASDLLQRLNPPHALSYAERMGELLPYYKAAAAIIRQTRNVKL